MLNPQFAQQALEVHQGSSLEEGEHCNGEGAYVARGRHTLRPGVRSRRD